MNIQHSTFNIQVDAGAVEPLTPRQRSIVVILALFVAATRLYAISHSMWDWDEALFASALQHYDVSQHHPHPPGFPLFFALAKLARIFIHDDFHALRAISVVSSLLLFPAIFALARSLRFRFRTCLTAALLFCFLPNVWYWGGTGFTDELALVTSLAGAALLLRDDRKRGTYILGCLLFAATMLVRAQNVLLAWPWIVASWRRWGSGRRRDVFAGTALIIVLVLTGYGIAAELTGIDDFIAATKEHQHYVATVDGALNPERKPMQFLLHDFLFDPFESRSASTAVFAFALLALCRPRRAQLDIVLTFEPNFLLAWFFLSATGISRLSLGYIAANALLAADGMDVVATFIASRLRTGVGSRRSEVGASISSVSDSSISNSSISDSRPPTPDARHERLALALQALFAAIIIGRYVVWVRPALREVRHTDSPPVQAMLWIRQNVARGSKVYIAGGLEPFAAYFLSDYNVIEVPSKFDPWTAHAEKHAFYAADAPNSSAQGAVNFRRPRKRLWALFNRRYFEASVLPMSGWIKFGPGWYGQEQDDEGEQWRWMAAESRTQLEPFAHRAQLGFSVTFPLQGEPPPSFTVTFDGRVIDRFVPARADVQRLYVVDSRSGSPDELVLSVDHVMNLSRSHKGNDPRDLGVQLHRILWKSAP
ncbi:MAG: hypothetical protein JO093_10725 [Acidobacteria bacterium]|nr:hypothetical protein [Acidobacteriota bacterium]MBV9186091.1 hypothetical protein [Acidobacteriota bacterium]